MSLRDVCKLSDGAGGRGRQCAVLFQLFAESDRTPVYTARRKTFLHQVLRGSVCQQVRGMQASHWNRLQGQLGVISTLNPDHGPTWSGGGAVAPERI